MTDFMSNVNTKSASATCRLNNNKVLVCFFFVGPCVKQTALSATLDLRMCADFKIYPSYQRIAAILSTNAIIA